ncbi:MAG: hypothetical protein KDJ90_00750 [Nitratireductor sp.]|nr:hypothetical protein [Nitratireductor sp.]
MRRIGIFVAGMAMAFAVMSAPAAASVIEPGWHPPALTLDASAERLVLPAEMATADVALPAILAASDAVSVPAAIPGGIVSPRSAVPAIDGEAPAYHLRL